MNDYLCKLENDTQKQGNANRVFYLALPPSVYVPASQMLTSTCMKNKGFSRIVIEKPFGHDLESFNKMTQDIKCCIDEQAIYRIDHYMAKEVVSGMMMLRFANTFLEPLWNRKYINGVMISLNESQEEGVGT